MDCLPSNFRSNTPNFRPMSLAKLRPSYGVYSVPIKQYYSGPSSIGLLSGYKRQVKEGDRCGPTPGGSSHCDLRYHPINRCLQ